MDRHRHLSVLHCRQPEVPQDRNALDASSILPFGLLEIRYPDIHELQYFIMASGSLCWKTNDNYHPSIQMQLAVTVMWRGVIFCIVFNSHSFRGFISAEKTKGKLKTKLIISTLTIRTIREAVNLE